MYERSLNKEIEEGLRKSIFSYQVRSSIDTFKAANGDKFGSIFVPYPMRDLWGGEEIYIAFTFDNGKDISDNKFSHNLFINTSSSFLEQNPLTWMGESSLTEIDFFFTLKNAQRQYQFRCDPKL
jgi:hypothetical protein